MPIKGGTNRVSTAPAVDIQPSSVACSAFPTCPLMNSRISVGMTMGRRAAFWKLRENHKTLRVICSLTLKRCCRSCNSIDFIRDYVQEEKRMQAVQFMPLYHYNTLNMRNMSAFCLFASSSQPVTDGWQVLVVVF